MASQALVIAHNNDFNKAILENNSFYFANANDVKKIIISTKKNDNLHLVANNLENIKNNFNWNKINGDYLELFQKHFSGISPRV
jgi:uncharacterized membrane protein